MIQTRPTTQPKPIELIDPEFEDGDTLEAVLDSITEVDKSVVDMEDQIARKVYLFYQKYEFDREIQFAKRTLRTDLASDIDRWGTFLQWTFLGEHDMAAEAIEESVGFTWADVPDQGHPTADFGSLVTDYWVFDLGSASQETLDLIPRDSLWAILRATSLAAGFGYDKGTDEYARAVGGEYRKLMLSPGSVLYGYGPSYES
jgi:hypothetical protein